MQTTAQRLKQIMVERSLKQADILQMAQPYCDKYHIKLNKSDLSQFVNGKVIPGQWKLTILGLALGVSESWLMGLDVPMEREKASDFPQSPDILPLPKTKRVPLLGTIACGEPILAEENLEGYVEAADEVEADFALRCRGDSMINARIYDGDIVFVRRQDDVEDGDLAAVLIGDEAMLKRVFKLGDRMQLRSENPAYPPIMVSGEDNLPIKILGKAVAFQSYIK